MVDEIQAYQSGRWVSPPKAAWRIFGFDRHDMKPAVMPLQVHLPNTQSFLTEFFSYNATHPFEPKYCFPEFVEHHVWHSQSKSWNKRKRGTSIGRLAFVTPSESERYFLRLLLARVAGPCSFADLLTVDGHKCSTFHESALKCGIVEPDDWIDRCLDRSYCTNASCFTMVVCHNSCFPQTE